MEPESPSDEFAEKYSLHEAEAAADPSHKGGGMSTTLKATLAGMHALLPQTEASLGLGRVVAFVRPLIHFIQDSPTYSVPLFLRRRCDRTLDPTGSRRSRSTRG